jgi:hypothetical protein
LLALGFKPGAKYGTVAKVLGSGGPVSRARAIAMLQVRVHPYLSSFYFDGDKVFSNYFDVMKEFQVNGARLKRSERVLKHDDTWFKIVGYARLNGVFVPLNPRKSYYFYLLLYFGLRGSRYNADVVTVPQDLRFQSVKSSQAYIKGTKRDSVDVSDVIVSRESPESLANSSVVYPAVKRSVSVRKVESVPEGVSERLSSGSLDYMCGFLAYDGMQVTIAVEDSFHVVEEYMKARGAEMLPLKVRTAAVHVWNDAQVRFSLAGGSFGAVIRVGFPYTWMGKPTMVYCTGFWSVAVRRKAAMAQALYVRDLLRLVIRHYELYVLQAIDEE